MSVPAVRKDPDLARYLRQTILPEVGIGGQRALARASVLLVGAGGLGSPLALYLAAAGIGRLGIVEFDTVDVTNLHRQVLYVTSDAGRPKLEAAAERLRALNPDVEVVPHPMRLDPANALELVRAYDLVADGSDNFATRYLVNDACVLTGVPNVYGSIDRFTGQVSVLAAPGGPCYRCLFPVPPPPDAIPSCAEAGVLGVLPGLVGTLQAAEVLKWILGIGRSLVGRLLQVDALSTTFRELRLERDPDCPVCGDRPSITSLHPTAAACAAPRMASSAPPTVPEITVRDLKDRLDRGERPFILDVRRDDEYAIANLGGHLIPLDELPERLEELAPYRDQPIVVHCRTGGRSARAVELLRQHGFEGAVNLKGGTHAWSDEIDPSMPKY